MSVRNDTGFVRVAELRQSGLVRVAVSAINRSSSRPRMAIYPPHQTKVLSARHHGSHHQSGIGRPPSGYSPPLKHSPIPRLVELELSSLDIAPDRQPHGPPDAAQRLLSPAVLTSLRGAKLPTQLTVRSGSVK